MSGVSLQSDGQGEDPRDKRLGARASARAPRRLILRASLALAVAATAVLALPGTVLAASGETSYVFGSSIKIEGGECSALTELEPSGASYAGAVAVNETTGDTYVYSRLTSSAVRIGPEGKCLQRLGPTIAKKSLAKTGGVAVDNDPSSPSFGDVYVVYGPTKEQQEVLKFTATGTPLSSITHEFGPIHGLAVDGAGKLWVYQESVTEEASLQSFSNAEVNEFASEIELSAAATECAPQRGLAVGPGDETFYIGRGRENRKGKCENTATVAVKLNAAGETATERTRGTANDPAFYAQLDNQETTGFAVNESTGEVFFDHGTAVSAFSPEGVFIQRFGEEAVQKGVGVAVEAGNEHVRVFDAGEGGIVDTFVPKAFEETLLEPGEGLPDGRGYEQVTPLNKLGSSIFAITKVFGQVQASEDGNAITYTSNAPIVTNPPVNRAPEPTQNLSRRGVHEWQTEDIMPPAGEEPAGYAANSGDAYEAFAYDLSSGVLDPAAREKIGKFEPLLAPQATETTPYTRDLTRPNSDCEPTPSTCYTPLVAPLISPLNDTTEVPFGAVGSQAQMNFTSATPNGQHAILISRVPLTSEGLAQGESEGLYEWSTDNSLKLVSVYPAGESAPGEGAPLLRLGGPGEPPGSIMRNAISSAGTRVVWSTGEGTERLYLRDTAKSETVRLDLKQDGKKVSYAKAVYQTASADTRHILFTDTVPLTEDAKKLEILEGSKPEEAATEAEERGLGDLYDCEVVEEGGKTGCKLTDLTKEEELKSPNEEAAVQGVIGASEDLHGEGIDVYYVADGNLGPSGGTGDCEPRNAVEVEEERQGLLAPTRCSLYVQHFDGSKWGPAHFIASLSSLDRQSWTFGALSAGGLTHLTSRVSPDGSHLAFMSRESLTGYDNEDVNPAAKGARDEEVFLYNRDTDKILCASCKPGGGQPQGIFDQHGSGEGIGLTVDRPESWAGMWLAGNIPGWTGRGAQAAVYQSRYLNDEGRLFFTSADPLVPAAVALRKEKVNGVETTVGVENVYEYEPNGVGSCTSANGCISLISSGKSPQESAFLDASVSGNDVFFLTSDQLLKQDQDTSFDVYDARVCGTGGCLPEPPEKPAPCAEEQTCKGAPRTVEAGVSSAPSAAPSAGNVNPTTEVRGEETTVKPKPKPKRLTRAQKLKRALHACHKKKSKRKRKACERAAQKRYGAKKGKKK